MKKRTVVLLTAFFSLFSVSFGNSGHLHAEPVLNTGCVVESSPFYKKLLHAGVLNVPIIRAAGKVEPMKILFIKARLFHYTPDLSKKEVWQSAEETARRFRGDCADKAIWLYTHMRQNGYQNISLVIGRYSPSSKVLHMWVTYEEASGEKLLLDPTMRRKPWKTTDFSDKYYKPLYALNGQDCIVF